MHEPPPLKAQVISGRHPKKAGALCLWAPPVPLQKWGEKQHHRPENWIELFFDIMFVPMAMALGGVMVDVLKNFQSGWDLAKALVTCGLIFTAIHRTWITFTLYINKFNQNDLFSHVIYALMMTTTAFLGAYALPNVSKEPHTAWNLLEHTEEFVLAFSVNQLLVMVLYMHVLWFLPEFKLFFAIQAAGQFAIVALFLVSLLFRGDVWMPLLWGVGFTVHSAACLCGSFVKCATVPVSIPHITARCGCFILVLLGESVIQVLGAKKNVAGSWFDTSLILSLWLVFNLALQYFHTQPHEPSKHALSRGRRPGFMWFNLHTLLGYAILAMGVGLELVFAHEFLDTLSIGLLCAGVGTSLGCLMLMRFMHKGKRGSWKRTMAYCFRGTTSLLLLLMPFIIGSRWDSQPGVQILLVVAVITALATSLDYVRTDHSHHATHATLLTREGPSDAVEGRTTEMAHASGEGEAHDGGHHHEPDNLTSRLLPSPSSSVNESTAALCEM